MADHQTYYVPEQSKWPIVATVGLGVTLYGAAAIMVNGNQGESTTGSWIMFWIGALIMAYMLFGWFGSVIRESRAGLYSDQMDRSFRWGMSWFIFSEVMFFAAFFGALFYVRMFVVPWLGGEGDKGSSNMLWEGFQASWPLVSNPNPEAYPGPKEVIGPWGLPLIPGRILPRTPERGDVVVFRHPTRGVDFIKRVIGLPGDEVQVQFNLNGRLWNAPGKPEKCFTSLQAWRVERMGDAPQFAQQPAPSQAYNDFDDDVPF